MQSVTVEIDATYAMNLMDRIRDHTAKAKMHGVSDEYLGEEQELLLEMIHLSLRLIGATVKPKTPKGDAK